MVIQITDAFIQWLIDEGLADTPDEAQALAERIAGQLYFTGAFRQTPAEHAAPALLAACKAFVEAWEKCLQLEKTDVALAMARAAIAAAEGVE